jgi:hypothetical protein
MLRDRSFVIDIIATEPARHLPIKPPQHVSRPMPTGGFKILDTAEVKMAF